ncbi:MAG: hypothetical protein ACM3H9_03235 [Rhodospirillaceae bacterium]
MRNAALASILAAALAAAGCLEKETTSTIYLRQDGSFDWVILEQNVRSDGRDEDSRRAEEAEWVEAASRGEQDPVTALLALGAQDVHVRWLRSRRPYGVMVDARFDSLARVFDRLLLPCEVPYESTVAEAGGIATWTLRADVGVDGERLDGGGADACGEGLDGLGDALDGLRVILESGTFTAAKGFTIQGTDAAVADEAAVEAAVKSTGVVELSLSWR